MPAPDSLTIRTASALARPEILDQALEHVANGGTLISFARVLDIKHGQLHNFICKTPETRKRYNEALNQRAEFDRETIMGQLRDMVAASPRELFTDDGRLKPVNEWPERAAALVAGFEVHEDLGKVDPDEDEDGAAMAVGRVAKVKLVDPLRKLELMGKELGLFKNKVEVSGKVTLAMLVEESLVEPATPTPASGSRAGGSVPVEVIDEIPKNFSTESGGELSDKI